MTSELILYLEPTPRSSLWTQTRQFFNASCTQPFAGNEALRYPIHCTMVGFFNKPSGQQGQGQEQEQQTRLDSLIEFLHKSIPLLSQRLASQAFQDHDNPSQQKKPAALIQGYVRPSPESLLIALLPSDELSGLVLELSQKFPKLGLRPKRINHLSLCYWDESEILRQRATSDLEQRQRAEWTDLAQNLAYETIPMLNPSLQESQQRVQVNSLGPHYLLNESWDIVLYEIHGRDKSNNLPYPLQELARWTL